MVFRKKKRNISFLPENICHIFYMAPEIFFLHIIKQVHPTTLNFITEKKLLKIYVSNLIAVKKVC